MDFGQDWLGALGAGVVGAVWALQRAGGRAKRSDAKTAGRPPAAIGRIEAARPDVDIDAADGQAGADPFHEDGTEELHADGQLRWSFLPLGLARHGAEQQRVQQAIVQSEPDFDFAPWAKLVRATPECDVRMGQEWRQRLSVEAQNLLGELDRLQATQIRPALKIAAIISASCPRYLLKEEVDARCCRWLRDGAPSQPGLLELGIRLWQWPRLGGALGAPEGIEGLAKTMLELYLGLAARDPRLTASLVRQTCSGTGVFWPDDVRETESLVELGRRLRPVFPGFTLDMLMSGLSSYRSPYFKVQTKPDAECRKIADEVFELQGQLSADNPAWRRPEVYNRLVVLGYRDSAWYPLALGRLLAHASDGQDQWRALRNIRCVALHAPLGHALSASALKRFAALSRKVELISRNDPLLSLCFGEVVEATTLCTDETCGERNRDFPPLPQHPLRMIGRKAYWACVDAVERKRSARSLHMLGTIIRRGEEEDSVAAMQRFVSTFEAKAALDPAAVAACLEDLAEHSHGVDQPPRQNRPQRCAILCRQVAPIFERLAPDRMPGVRKAMAAPMRAYI